MLERMADFFEARVDGYDCHMMTNIESADEFYPFTAMMLPTEVGARVLDLGCGTGLELGEYFGLNLTAGVVGIDVSRAMLAELERKYSDKDITLVCGSYFDLPLGAEIYDAAVSVESLHHFTKEEKVALYSKLRAALKAGGYFILTDYFASTAEEETTHREKLLTLMRDEGALPGELYHYDTPLTVEHEAEALREGGFSSVEVLRGWGATYTLRAVK